MTRRLPAEAPVLVGKELRQTQEEQQRFNEDLLQLGLGSPPAHGADHDVGAVDPLSGGSTPISVTIGGVADPGDGPGYMREDAQLVVGAGVPVEIGSANAAGVAGTAARSDHVHKGYYQIVQEEGAPLTQRGKLNFVGAGVVASDDAGNDRTNVTIAGAVDEDAQLLAWVL